MVDFRQLNSQKKQPPVIEPRQLFQTLQRDKQHEYLRDIQGDVLNEWFGRRDERDLIIKMNTGSGKTLVGLVVLWSRLKEGKGPALYLCPNRHLVSQVRSEAEKLGIPHVDFEPNNLFPAGFYDSTSILVTTVQKLRFDKHSGNDRAKTLQWPLRLSSCRPARLRDGRDYPHR